MSRKQLLQLNFSFSLLIVLVVSFYFFEVQFNGQEVVLNLPTISNEYLETIQNDFISYFGVFGNMLYFILFYNFLYYLIIFLPLYLVFMLGGVFKWRK